MSHRKLFSLLNIQWLDKEPNFSSSELGDYSPPRKRSLESPVSIKCPAKPTQPAQPMEIDQPVPIKPVPVKPTSNGEHAKVDQAIDQMISEMGQTNMRQISAGSGSGPIMGPPQLQSYQNNMSRPVNSPHSVSSVNSGNMDHPPSPMASSLSPAPSPAPQPTQYQPVNSPVNPVSPHNNMVSPHQNMVSPHQNMVSPHQNMVSPHQNVVSPQNMAHQRNMTPSPQNVVSPQNLGVSPHNSRPPSASSYNQVLSPQPNASSPMLSSGQMLPNQNKNFLSVPNNGVFPNGSGMNQNNVFNGNKEPYNPFSHTNVMGNPNSPNLNTAQQQQLQQQQILQQQQQQFLSNQFSAQGQFPQNRNPFQNF